MLLQILKKNKIILFIMLLIISIMLMISTRKVQKPVVETFPELQKETQVSKPKPQVLIKPKEITDIKQKIEIKKQDPVIEKNSTVAQPPEEPISDYKIDLIEKRKPLIYSLPPLEINQIMQEYQKINTFSQDKYLIQKEEEWRIDYTIGLEENAIEQLKESGQFKPKMLNGKIGFSTSF